MGVGDRGGSRGGWFGVAGGPGVLEGDDISPEVVDGGGEVGDDGNQRPLLGAQGGYVGRLGVELGEYGH